MMKRMELSFIIHIKIRIKLRVSNLPGRYLREFWKFQTLY